jgi:phosphonate transport system substrate-binding protein
MITRRTMLAATLPAIAVPAATLPAAPAMAQGADWRAAYPTVAMGVVTSENEADRVIRYRPVVAYLERKFGVKVDFRNATDYAGVIEAMVANKIQVAHFGPAAYAQAWIVSSGKVEPLLGSVDLAGDFGYFSVAVVKSDSPFQTIDDL